MGTWKPNLFEVDGTTIVRVGEPKVRSEKRSAFVNRNSVSPDQNVRIVRSERNTSWVLYPADGTHCVPNTDEVRLADGSAKVLFKFVGYGRGS